MRTVLRLFSWLLCLIPFSIYAQIGLLQPRTDHFSDFSYLDIGGPSCIGETAWVTFSDAAPRNNNATLIQIDYDLNGFPGSVYLDYNPSIGKYVVSHREWMSSSFNVDSVQLYVSSITNLVDSCAYTFSKGGPPNYIAAQMKWLYDTNSRVSQISESSLFSPIFSDRRKWYFYSGSKLDSSRVLINNDSTQL